jgi:hypothetical protein
MTVGYTLLPNEGQPATTHPKAAPGKLLSIATLASKLNRVLDSVYCSLDGSKCGLNNCHDKERKYRKRKSPPHLEGAPMSVDHPFVAEWVM